MQKRGKELQAFSIRFGGFLSGSGARGGIFGKIWQLPMNSARGDSKRRNCEHSLPVWSFFGVGSFARCPRKVQREGKG